VHLGAEYTAAIGGCRSICACNSSLKAYKGVGVPKDIHKKYGGKGIHYVGGYTQAHLTLWIRRMVGILQLKK